MALLLSVPLGNPELGALGTPTLPSVPLLSIFFGVGGAPGRTPLVPGITPFPGMVVSCFLLGSILALGTPFFLSRSLSRAAGCASAPE